jgi:ribosomal protein S18 acetylase RimI-like enzyme
VQIREFQVDDYPQVIALWEMVGLRISRSDNLQGLRRKLERDADLFLVAEEDDRIVGVIMGCFDGRRGWMNHLAVAPEQQNTGVGSLLVGLVEERLKAKGCEKVNLLIEPANASVQGFYDRLGYARDDLIFMEKWLS